MSGLLKIPNARKRVLSDIIIRNPNIPPMRKSKLAPINEEFILYDRPLSGERTTIPPILDNMNNKRECVEYGTNHKIFAVFVCGPDPMQCVENPTSDNQRGKTYINLLQNNGEDEEWREYMIYRDQFPSAHEVASFSAIIITGSKHDAYTNDADWKIRLQHMIRDIYYNHRTVKILGVCFGHQIIIHSFRNSEDEFVGRNQVRKKMEIGLVSVNLTQEFHSFWERFDLKVNAETLRIHQAHQDVVYQLPEYIQDAEVMAHSKYTNIEMYHIGDNIVGIQGHPEFTTSYITTAIGRNNKYMSRIYSNQEMDEILQNMRKYEANRLEWKYLFGKWIRI